MMIVSFILPVYLLCVKYNTVHLADNLIAIGPSMSGNGTRDQVVVWPLSLRPIRPGPCRFVSEPA